MPIHSLFLVYDCAAGTNYSIRYVRIDRDTICATKPEAIRCAWRIIYSQTTIEDTAQILHLSDIQGIWHHSDTLKAKPHFETDRDIEWTIRKDDNV